MYHGVTFLDMEEEDGMKSYEDFHLIPRRRLYIGPPEVKTNMIDIPGGDGYLDTSEAPDGRAHYGARQASWEFEVERAHRRLYPSLYSSSPLKPSEYEMPLPSASVFQPANV